MRPEINLIVLTLELCINIHKVTIYDWLRNQIFEKLLLT